MIRRRIKRWLYGSCPGFAGSFPYFGSRIYFPPRSIIFDAACSAGIYESDNLRAIQVFARDGTWVFDVGANIGLMSVPVLSARKQVKVASYEPSPGTVAYLQRTHAESGFADRWEIVPKALGKTQGAAELFVSDPGLGAYDGLRDTGRAAVERTLRVEMATVDSEWERFGKPVVSVLKLDVEGAELDVLEGASRCIAACRPAIVTEWSLRNIGAYGRTLEELLSTAQRIGYRVWAIPAYAEVRDNVALQVHAGLIESYLLYPGALS